MLRKRPAWTDKGETTPPARAISDATSTAWQSATSAEVAEKLVVDITAGLDEQTVTTRLAAYGANRLTAERHESLWETILEEAREPMILLLLGTGVLYGVLGGLRDALTIFAIILVVIAVEIVNERRAETALAALKTLAVPTALMRREGQPRETPTEQIVPGDVLLLAEGQRVPADARLIECFGLLVDESALTGESAPVDKRADITLPTETPLAERANLVFAGTAIARGRGSAVVVATGRATELGHVAALAAEVREPRTPLQQAMRQLTRWLVWFALGVSVLVPLLGVLLAHQSPQQMALTALSLAFATIPEELPILITIALAIGAYRLARRHAIVKRLRAAETLSAVTVIATDKTGTLTENHMTVSRYTPDDSPDRRRRLLEIGALCNDALPRAGAGARHEEAMGYVGDPMEIALLEAAAREGIDVARLRHTTPLRAEFPFDAARKRMSVAYARDGLLCVAVKGAPEAVLAQVMRVRAPTSANDADSLQPITADERQTLLRSADALTSEGLRVLALAEKRLPDRSSQSDTASASATSAPLTQEEAESDLTFVGFVGLADPPRPEVAPAIAATKAAGVHLVMITGDHPLTARAIAREVGLVGDSDQADGRHGAILSQGATPSDAEPDLLTGSELDRLTDEELREAVGQVVIYARTTPEHKLRIVRALRARGERVAVTGDGINDAPALAAADIGIAMGETGTDVAREAASIVLADDNFATLTHAMREGRLLFANLKKVIRYYLAVKVALIATTLLPVLLLLPVPFTPVQIIVTELFMDVAASVTFVSERAESDLMRQPPRDPHEPFMNRRMVTSIFAAAFGLFAAAASAYLVAWYTGDGLAHARTLAFVTWLLGHVLLALNLRSEREPLRRLGLFSNRLMVVWAAATAAFVALITLVPPLRAALNTTALAPWEWALAVGLAIVGGCWPEVYKLAASRNRERRGARDG